MDEPDEVQSQAAGSLATATTDVDAKWTEGRRKISILWGEKQAEAARKIESAEPKIETAES